jgi:hypothetical protein
MRVAKAGHGHSREEIDVGVAVEVGDGGPGAVIERQLGEQRDALLARRDQRLLLVEQAARARARAGMCV